MPEKKDEKRSFTATPEAAKAAETEEEVNNLLKMSPLSRLVLAKELQVTELKKIRESVEKLVEIFGNAKPSFEPLKTQTKPASTPAKKVEDSTPDAHVKVTELKKALGPELAELLNFDAEQSSNFVIVKPKKYLGSENFASIGKVIRENKGEYVSAGRDSHFKVPKLV